MRRLRRQRYHLDEFKLIGFSLENAREGTERVKVLTRAALTSDDSEFHHYVRSFAEDVDSKLRAQGHSFHLSQANSFAVIIEPDQSATLYIDPSIRLEVIAKRAVEAGEAVFTNDIGDIRGGSIKPKRRPDQRVLICIRTGWKFLLLFDLTPGEPLDIDRIERTIGVGMRRLMFEQLYRSMANDQSLSTLIEKGWFPFNELIGPEFDQLHKAVVSDFNLEAVEEKLVTSFDAKRIARLTGNWWRHPQFEKRKSLLEEGAALFAEGRHIASLKTLISEIEGILRERHVPRSEGRQGIDKVLTVAFESVLQSADGDTMYFPVQFGEYLRKSIFAPFDPELPADEATRNTIVHGRASIEAYTAVRALQTILVLDQIYRFLTLPEAPALTR